MSGLPLGGSHGRSTANRRSDIQGSHRMSIHNAELAQIGQAKRGITNEERTQIDVIYARRRRDPGIVHIISLLGSSVCAGVF